MTLGFISDMETNHIICIIKSDIKSDMTFDMKSVLRSDMSAGMTLKKKREII